MTGDRLLLLADLSPTQQAVRDQFQHGGSATSVLLVLLAILAVGILVYVLTWFQERVRRAARHHGARKLFRDLLHKANLSEPQRRFLETVARDLRLVHPTKVLLSATLFDEAIQRWYAHRGRKEPPEKTSEGVNIAAQTRAALFPRSWRTSPQRGTHETVQRPPRL